MTKRTESLLTIIPLGLELSDKVSGRLSQSRDLGVADEPFVRILLEVDRAGVAAEAADATEGDVESLDLDRLQMAVRNVVAGDEDEEQVLQSLSYRLGEYGIPAAKDNARGHILHFMRTREIPLNILAILARSEDEDLALAVFAAPNFPMDKLENLDESQFLLLAKTVFLLPYLSVELGRYLFKRLGVTNCLAFMVKQIADEPDAIPMNPEVFALFREEDEKNGNRQFKTPMGIFKGGGLTFQQLQVCFDYMKANAWDSDDFTYYLEARKAEAEGREPDWDQFGERFEDVD